MLDELQHFLSILEEGTLTRAAKKSGLSQPAMSASVVRLETWAGAPLLSRSRKGSIATAEGRALAPWARRVLMSFEGGRRAVQDIAQLREGDVRIAAGPTVCTYLLPIAIAAFRKEHPGVRFRVRELATNSAREDLDSGRVDIALVFDQGDEPFYCDEMVLVGAPGFAKNEPIEELPFVAFRRGTSSRRLLDETFPGVDVVTELGGISAIKANVRAGVGIALISRIAALRDLQSGQLEEVLSPHTPAVRNLSVVRLPDERLPPAARTFLEFISERREALWGVNPSDTQ